MIPQMPQPRTFRDWICLQPAFPRQVRLALLLSCFSASVTFGADSKRVDYNFQIRPLLSDRCFTCHGPDEKARKKKLRLDTKEGLFKELEDGMAVVKPGDTNKS